MSKQLLTDELRALLETGKAWQVQQLVQIGFPCIDAYGILKRRLQKRQDNPEIWAHLGYKEERKRSSWFSSYFGRCGACRALLFFDPHEAFSCGHLDCRRKNTSCCFVCGPSFDQLWKFLRREGSKASNIEWPKTPDNLFDEWQLKRFANSVVETHKMAFQQIRTEVLVSFALTGSSTGISSFLELHRDLVDTVKSRNDVPTQWAWERAFRAAKDFELLSEALKTGLWANSEQWGGLKIIEGCLYTSLSPIRKMFEAYSLSEFLERIPLLSRKTSRSGMLNTDFTICDEIKKGDRGFLTKKWREQSQEIYRCCTYYTELDEWERMSDIVQAWKERLIGDVADICFVFPQLSMTFLELSKDLESHGDLLSSSTISTGCKKVSTKE